MPHLRDILTLLGAAALGVVLVWAVRWRRRDHALNMRHFAEQEVCDHLRPAYDLLASRGHTVLRVGQKTPELPLEIHMAPPAGPQGGAASPFDPKQVYDELKLAEPVFVSERNVLYCKEDWCEIHPSRS